MVAANHILIVDDDTELLDLLERYLASHGFQIETSRDYDSGLNAVRSGSPDLVVLDVMLPGGSGFDLLRQLRTESSVPIMLLTARGDPVDRVVGLELGADDYLGKPFDAHELVSRIRAILRRSRPAPQRGDWIQAGELSMSSGLRKARLSGHDLPLTSIEFNLLEYLVKNLGAVVSREQLTQDVLGRRIGLLDRSVDVHISRLRRKLIDCGGDGELIKSVRGCGYCFAAMASAA